MLLAAAFAKSIDFDRGDQVRALDDLAAAA